MPLSTIYFSYIVAFSFICWRKTEYWKKHVTSNGMTVSAVLEVDFYAFILSPFIV
jgi:hypothetical protein